MVCWLLWSFAHRLRLQHESGIHQDGMIKNKATYEIMTPESIGLMRGESQSGAGIVLGKHSGRNAVGTRLVELGCVASSRPSAAAVCLFRGGGPFLRLVVLLFPRLSRLRADAVRRGVVTLSRARHRDWAVTARARPPTSSAA
jgi:hypothetical protein